MEAAKFSRRDFLKLAPLLPLSLLLSCEVPGGPHQVEEVKGEPSNKIFTIPQGGEALVRNEKTKEQKMRLANKTQVPIELNLHQLELGIKAIGGFPEKETAVLFVQPQASGRHSFGFGNNSEGNWKVKVSVNPLANKTNEFNPDFYLNFFLFSGVRIGASQEKWSNEKNDSNPYPFLSIMKDMGVAFALACLLQGELSFKDYQLKLKRYLDAGENKLIYKNKEYKLEEIPSEHFEELKRVLEGASGFPLKLKNPGIKNS